MSIEPDNTPSGIAQRAADRCALKITMASRAAQQGGGGGQFVIESRKAIADALRFISERASMAEGHTLRLWADSIDPPAGGR